MLIQDQETSSLLETKFELMMNMNSQKLRKEIEALRQQIDILSTELESVKKNQSRQPAKNEAYQATLGMQFAQPQQIQQPVPQQAQPAQSQGTQPRSRTGNTNPEDVSIEKMFYFGGKR